MPTFEALTADSSEPLREIARLLRELVRSRFPAAVEQIDLGDRVAAYGTSERMRDIVFAIAPHSAHVNLQLADGVELDDPTATIRPESSRAPASGSVTSSAGTPTTSRVRPCSR